MKVVYILIAITFFGGFGIASYLRSCTFVMDPGTIARINGQSIPVEDFQRAYNNTLNTLRDRLGDKFSEDLLKEQNIKTEVLRGLLQRILILQRAQDLGLTVTDEELRSTLARMFSDENGRFDVDRYRRALRANRLHVAQFEESERTEILLSKVEELIASSVSVTDDEVAIEYRLKNEKVNLSFVAFDPEKFTAALNPTEAARESAAALLKSLSAGQKPPKGLIVGETGFFSRDEDYLPKIGFSMEGVAQAFSLRRNHPVFNDPILIGGKYYAIWLKGRQDIIPSRFEKDKERFTRETLSEKRQRVIHNWIESLTENARITLNQPLLDSFGEARREEE